MLADDERPVSLVLPQTAITQGTVMTLGAEFKAVGHFTGSRIFQPAALGIELSGRTFGAGAATGSVAVGEDGGSASDRTPTGSWR
jgi:hypothetical protein